MSELLDTAPNHQKDAETLRPFSELLEKKDLVYHGVGSDLVALYGIASHGLSSAAQQEERLGYVNSNTTSELTKTSSDLVSVAETPQPERPNTAFVTYIENSPVSFAIDPSNRPMVQPSDRGFYDEAFIQGAEKEDIVGIVVDGDTIDQRIVDQPIVSRNVSPDVVVQKTKNVFDFLVRELDPQLISYKEELDALLVEIEHITSDQLRTTFGMITDTDHDKILLVDEWLRDKVALALEAKYGGKDMSVLDLVRLNFPATPLYVNNHTDVAPYSEDDMFAKLELTDSIGYEKWDGTPDDPTSTAKARQRYHRRRAQQQS
jgi:hypothetical protein